MEDDPTAFDDVGVGRNRERLPGVLLDHKDGLPLISKLADEFEDKPDYQWG